MLLNSCFRILILIRNLKGEISEHGHGDVYYIVGTIKQYMYLQMNVDLPIPL